MKKKDDRKWRRASLNEKYDKKWIGKKNIYCSLLSFRWGLSSNGLQIIIVPGASNEYCIYFYKSHTLSLCFSPPHPLIPSRARSLQTIHAAIVLCYFLCFCYSCSLYFKNNSKIIAMLRTIVKSLCAKMTQKKNGTDIKQSDAILSNGNAKVVIKSTPLNDFIYVYVFIATGWACACVSVPVCNACPLMMLNYSTFT